MSEDLGELPVYYTGRLWDAPLTDGAIKADPEFIERVLLAVEATCDLCEERLLPEDEILLLPFMKSHLECNIRSILGDVQHLEGRCGFCDHTTPRPLPTDEYATYREGAKATLQWLITHNRGRFRDDNDS